MKTETKISSIALICALCAVVATPAISAAPVRALGGAGTYSSASSAASSKTSGATTASTRAGAVRVVPSATKATTSSSASSTTSSSRIAATPRLSLGKYLAGNRVVKPSGGSTSGGTTGGVTDGEFVSFSDWKEHLTAYRELEDSIGKLDERIEVLENSVLSGVSQEELDTAIAGVQTQIDAIDAVVDALPADVADIVVSAELDAAIAALKQDLANSDTVAGLSDSVEKLQQDLLSVQNKFVDYVLKADFDKRVEDVDAEIQGINSAADALALRVADLESKTNEGVAGEKDFQELSAAVDQIKESLNRLPADGENVASTAQVEAVRSELNAIAAKIPESGVASVQDVNSISESVTALQSKAGELDAAIAKTVLKSDYDAKVADLEADIASLTSALADHYTKAESDAAIAAAVKPINDWLTTERMGDLELALTNLDALIGAKELVEEYATVKELQKVKTDLESIITGGEANDGLVYESDLSELDAKLVALIDANSEADKLTSSTLNTIRENLETKYYTSAQIDELLANKADASDLDSAMDLINALQSADEAISASVKALQDADLVTADTLQAQVSGLVAADTALQTAIDDLAKTVPSIDGLATQQSVEDLATELRGADTALQNAINAMVRPDVNKAYVDEAVAELNSAIDGLKAADVSMQATIDTINETIATLATKKELGDVKSELQAAIDKINAGEVELTNYYTKGEADAIFATIESLGGLKIDAANILGKIGTDQIEDGAVTAEKISTGNAPLGENQVAMLSVDEYGNQVWVTVDIAQ